MAFCLVAPQTKGISLFDVQEPLFSKNQRPLLHQIDPPLLRLTGSTTLSLQLLLLLTEFLWIVSGIGHVAP